MAVKRLTQSSETLGIGRLNVSYPAMDVNHISAHKPDELQNVQILIQPITKMNAINDKMMWIESVPSTN